ncbi:hypothetical protein [Ammonifex thiophilus]|uniref:Uncharacterized protein n=1 Tax=Ammonifex thiophilus TaxID=444093 RepID=A0A3D8P258_9THEO|nr:hypothetical protein [Ammonifex thiophilus]RDV82324.1 hypothetical protein DXX99_07880 [Ammonifex thiophilus]
MAIHDTEDKEWWVIYGEKLEYKFIRVVAPRIGLLAVRNPEKERDPKAPDLLIDEDYKLADLKTQHTPFFRAGELYRIDPRYAVTFNRSDYEYYRDKYPGVHVIFWVDWQETEKSIGGRLYRVEPLTGVWRCTLDHIGAMVRAGKAPLHEYERRRGDDRGNARDSYVLDLREMICLWRRP